MIKSERDIYQLLEENLKKSNKPLTCNDLWDMDGRIRESEHDGGPNKVSDYLGFMWREGLIVRYPAPRTRTSFARFAYAWKPTDDKPLAALKDSPKPLIAKNNIEILETKGGVTIELANVSITIRNR